MTNNVHVTKCYDYRPFGLRGDFDNSWLDGQPQHQLGILFVHDARRKNELGQPGKGARNALMVARTPLNGLRDQPLLPQAPIMADAPQFAMV